MTSPSTEGALVAAAGHPLPEGPSLRWRRAAQGLRWMRWAIYAGLASLVLGVVSSVAGTPTGAFGVVASCLYFTGYCLCPAAYAAGLWRFGSVPAFAGVSRPARRSFGFVVSFGALTLLGGLGVYSLFFFPSVSHERHLMPILLTWELAGLALIGAHLGLLVRALDAALRSSGETPPAWAPRAVAAYVALCILICVVPMVVALAGSAVGRVLGVNLFGVLLWAMGFGYTGFVVFNLALASLMGRTARALARQESLDTISR